MSMIDLPPMTAPLSSTREKKMDDKLKPCPFCGENLNVICTTDYQGDHRPAYAVSCRTRECHGAIFSLGYGLFDTREKAISAWNRRSVSSPDVAVLREALEPFAKEAEHYDIYPVSEWSDDTLIRRTSISVDFGLTVGDLRRARQALAGAGKVVEGEYTPEIMDWAKKAIEQADEDELVEKVAAVLLPLVRSESNCSVSDKASCLECTTIAKRLARAALSSLPNSPGGVGDGIPRQIGPFSLDCGYVPSGADCAPESPHCVKLVYKLQASDLVYNKERRTIERRALVTAPTAEGN